MRACCNNGVFMLLFNHLYEEIKTTNKTILFSIFKCVVEQLFLYFAHFVVSSPFLQEESDETF